MRARRHASPISTSRSCARRRGSARIATRCARASPAIAGIALDRVGVKATTNEKLGFTGAARGHRGLGDRDHPPAAGARRCADHETALAAPRARAPCAGPRGLTVATAESCTGGLVAGALTEIAGSSDVVDRGFVTYSNAAKEAHARRAGGHCSSAHGAVSQRDRARPWRRARSRIRPPISRWRSPASPARRRHAGRSRSAWCISRRRARRPAPAASERRFGDIGRARRCAAVGDRGAGDAGRRAARGG